VFHVQLLSLICWLYYGYIDHTLQDDASGEDTDSDDGSDAYYIMFRKSDELMPQSCVFEQLDRVDADK